jgi:hypothetical protein
MTIEMLGNAMAKRIDFQIAPDIRNGDLFGTPPSNFFTRFLCRIIKADTFHWGMIIGRDKYGYVCSESIGKGTAVTRFAYHKARIYRIKNIKEPTTFKLVSIHSQHGESLYDMPVNILTGVWFLLKHYLKIVIPIVKNHTFNCQEHVVYMSSMLGVKIIPETEYPYCINLEKSDSLEYLGTLDN